MTPSAVAIRHVGFEDLGLLGPLLSRSGFSTSYLDPPYDDDAWRRSREADLLVVLGGPVGVGDLDTYPFLGEELEVIGERVSRRRPTLGICLGAQLLAIACGGGVRVGRRAEIGYGPLALTDAGRGSVLAPLAEVPVLHWHGDELWTPPHLPPLASTAACPNQAFADGTNVLGLQFHLEAGIDSLERWLVGHAYELAARGIDVADLRRDAAVHGARLASLAREVFAAWLSGLTLGERRSGA